MSRFTAYPAIALLALLIGVSGAGLAVAQGVEAIIRGTVNVTNLLDETHYAQIGFCDQLAYGAPRGVTLSLGYGF